MRLGSIGLGCCFIGIGSLAIACGDDEGSGGGDTTSSTTATSTVTGATTTGAASTSSGGQGGDGGGGGSLSCELSGTWEVVDDFTFDANTDSIGRRLKTGPDGDVWAAGILIGGAQPMTLVRSSSDGGASWTSSDVLDCRPSRGLAVGPDGAGYFGCGMNQSGIGNVQHAMVLSAPAPGGAFSTFEDFVLPGLTASCGAPALAAGSDGTIYMQGGCTDDQGMDHAYVRATSDGGANWDLLDDDGTLGPMDFFSSIEAKDDGTVWLSGSVGDEWVIRRYEGGTWTADDTFSYAAGAGRDIAGVMNVSHARVYAGGQGPDAQGALHLVMRRRDTSGNWTTIHDIETAAGSMGGGIGGIVEHPSGALIMTANLPDNANIPEAVTYRSDDDGATWNAIDNYQYQGAKPTTDSTLAMDASGNLYTVHAGTDAQDQVHWLVRKMACQ